MLGNYRVASQLVASQVVLSSIQLLLLSLFIVTANWFSPGGSGTTIRQTHKYTFSQNSVFRPNIREAIVMGSSYGMNNQAAL
jgi:hypothetical protein